MERTASRRTAFGLATALGLAVTVIALVVLAVDHATTNSVRSRVEMLYAPFGAVPDPAVPWLFLSVVFGVGGICWALAVAGAVHRARWTRWFSTAAFLCGGAVLLFGYLVSEHDAAILPTGWRVFCLCVAIYGAVPVLIAWLPTTASIRA